MSIAEKLQTIAENEKKVYDKGEERGHMQGFGEGFTNGYSQGYEVGKAEGGGGDSGSYEDGFEDGKKAEYDAFWDEFQNYGKPTVYPFAFRASNWTDKNFTPKYDFIASYSSAISNMFNSTSLTDTKKTIDHSCGGPVSNVFYGATKLKTIRKLILSETSALDKSFQNCTALENITIAGTIGQDFDIHWSTKLSKESILSIMWALSETSSGKTITLSKTAVDVAFYDPGLGFIGSDTLEWGQRVLDRPNWTVNLV